MDNLSASEVHNGYFAADKNGQWKDSRDTKGEGGRTKDDDTAYTLIMKDKERLLDINEPLRFIFSHSALRGVGAIAAVQSGGHGPVSDFRQ